MSSQDFLKYLVQEMVKYMETPKAERKEARLSRKQVRPGWKQHWFGMIPFSLHMYAKRQKNRSLRSEPGESPR
ncbi:hypothetical protein GCM10011571_26420 [Marinithermofilum abyssi]|uniref:YqzE family protein n=1 Tax=Marinithermofilum abyssi TaxID=1571185 RepID=A0A8J2YEG0_9BACL|nr:YqzE family protein [Marinithermofilum abyssi]GGE23067.1 hypothetical protein GCM10011571_26420 [Marinithermofilum abyssi]